MAYTKKTWVSGETPLSAENMNHIEQGVADAHNDISSLNTKIPTIQSGTESFTVASGEDPQVNITFPKAFTNTPLISLEYKNYGSWIRLSNTSVNKYGITFNAKNTYSGELTFSILWQAIGV